MNVKTYITLFLLLGLVSVLEGQEIGQCAASAWLQQDLIANPEIAQNREQVVKNIDRFLQGGKVSSRNVMVIPVVFHVVYFSNVENVSNQQVYSQIAALNRDFRKKNENLDIIQERFKNDAADIGIEFCLAEKDPFGNETNGITRTQTPYSNIGIRVGSNGERSVFYTDAGGEDAWDTKKYMNVWVCKLGNSILGTATFPGAALPEEDGILIDFSAFGSIGTAKSPNKQGKTLVHEIGHYLDLQHIWGNHIGDCSSDDGIDDTPSQERPSQGCPNNSQVSCNSFDMFNNYMDYSTDECLALFTYGQKERMLAALQTFRSGLLSSNVCTDRSLDNPLSYLKVYTNPVDDELFVALKDGNIFEVSVSIFSMYGEMMLKSKKFFFPGSYPIDVSHYPQGAYIVVFSSSDDQVIKKIIVNH